MSLLRRTASRTAAGSSSSSNPRSKANSAKIHTDPVVVCKKQRTSLTTSSPTRSTKDESESELTETEEEEEEDEADTASSDVEQDSATPYRQQSRNVSGRLIVAPRRAALIATNANSKQGSRFQHVRILTPKSSNHTCLDLSGRSLTGHRKSASSASLTDAFASTSLRSSVSLTRSASTSKIADPNSPRPPKRTLKSFLDVRRTRAAQEIVDERPERILNVRSRVANAMRDMLPTRGNKRKRKASTSTEESMDVEGDGPSETESAASFEADEEEAARSVSSSPEPDEAESTDPVNSSSTEYHLHHALPNELLRLRKDRLIELFQQLLSDYPESAHAREHESTDAEAQSKSELVEAIIAFRTETDQRPLHVRQTSKGSAKSKRSNRTPSVSSITSQSSRHRRARSSIGSRPSSDQLQVRRPTLEVDAQPARFSTPIARRTRAAVRSSQLGRTSGSGDESASDSNESGDDDSADDDETQVRVLRSGKHVPLDAELPAVNEAADMSIDEISEASAESDAESEENIDESNDIDLSTATDKTLLRLRRDDLAALCQARDLPSDGTKKELAAALLQWQQSQPTEEDSESDADTSFRPSEPDSNVSDHQSESGGSDTETEREQEAPKTARAIKGKGNKNETKTQALKQVDASTSRDKTGRKPLLLDSHRPKRRSRPETPTADTTSEEEEEEAEIIELDLESLNLQDKAIAPDQIKRGEKIGSGGFKDVYTGRFRNVKVAVADIRSHLTENEIKELSLMRDLRHDNIVKLIGVVKYEDPSPIPCSLVTELCLNGDLFDFIRRDAPAPPFEKMLKIMLDIASGLDYLHNRSPKIIHRDMKSSNVLITARGVAKLTDFGLARVKNSTRSMIKSLVGTVNWQAPELWVPHPRYNEKVDCYAAGMVFWECLQWHQSTKKYPFEGMNEHAIYQEVGHKQVRPATASMSRHWGSEIVHLTTAMWAQSPADRPAMTEVVKTLSKMLATAKLSKK